MPDLRKLQLDVELEGSPKEAPDVSAFVFDPNGKLLAATPVKGGKAVVQVPSDDSRGTRILLGPSALADRPGGATLEALQRAGAHEPSLKLDPRQRTLELLPIPEIDWIRWLLCPCRVRGRVVRPVNFNGQVQDMPICKARVHILEVDRFPFIVPKLPDDILLRIRDLLLEREVLIPVPQPDPPPFLIDPGFIDPSPELVARFQPAVADPVGPAFKARHAAVATVPDTAPAHTAAVTAATTPVLGRKVPVGRARHLRPEVRSLATAPELANDFHAMPKLELDSATRTALSSDSLEAIRKALIDNALLIRPLFCGWPWLWPWFTSDEVAVVTTDDNGRFDVTMWYPCKGDRPDLYFWVEYPLSGVWTSVYRPRMACNTYWDYACGSEVTIRVTDPRVPWCDDTPPLAGLQLSVVSVGGNVSFDEVQPESAGATAGLTTNGEPFGGSLEPAVWFGSGLLPSGVSHYRWSFRKVGEADWRTSDRQVVRHYAEIGAGGALTFKPFLLGPDPAVSSEVVFKIPPKDPPAGGDSWAPMISPRENNATAFFLSYLEAGGDALAGAGLYELKLELFKIVGGAPQRVNLTDAGIKIKVPVGAAPFGPGEVPAVDAPAPNLLMDAGKVVGFRWVLHVDNNRCWRDIGDVMVGANAAGPCGFISYAPGDTAAVTFRAFHPNGFATFGFGVTKGSSGGVPDASASGLVTDPAPNGFMSMGSGWCRKDVPVSTLLNAAGTSCTKAAFAETLDIDALATDGWDRLSYLDSGPGDGASTKAFALEPEEVDE